VAFFHTESDLFAPALNPLDLVRDLSVFRFRRSLALKSLGLSDVSLA